MNDTLDHLNLIDRQGVPSKNSIIHIFSSTHGIFSRIDHILSHKTSINKFNRIEITSSIFFWPQQYETRNQLWKENGKNTNMWRLNNMLLKNQWVNEKIKEEIRKHFETNENKNTACQYLWNMSKVPLRNANQNYNELSSHTGQNGLHQKMYKQ